MLIKCERISACNTSCLMLRFQISTVAGQSHRRTQHLKWHLSHKWQRKKISIWWCFCFCYDKYDISVCDWSDFYLAHNRKSAMKCYCHCLFACHAINYNKTTRENVSVVVLVWIIAVEFRYPTYTCMTGINSIQRFIKRIRNEYFVYIIL